MISPSDYTRLREIDILQRDLLNQLIALYAEQEAIKEKYERKIIYPKPLTERMTRVE